MKGLIISFAAVAPMAFLVTEYFGAGDWQFWAFLGAGFWWRAVAPLADE